jgi:cob(I)alamin adenosyltransferase
MAQSAAPSMRAYSRHVFVCNHGDCAGSELGQRLQLRFLELNRKHGLSKLRNPERVKCSLVDCLGVCSGGPIVVVYPDGIWYHHVDETALELIYEEHILNGRPVEALVFHRLYPPGQEPAYAPAVRGDQGAWSAEAPDIPTTADAASTAGSDSSGPAGSDVRTRIRRARKKKGLVIVNTGHGKGKTTAALGVMTRAWGRKMRVGVLQFLKNENARFGEIKAAERMGDIDWISTGDGWTWTSKDMDETEARARHGWTITKEHITRGTYDLLILDEFTYTMHFGWLDPNEVVAWLKANKPEMLHLIITGRNAPAALIEYADLVTEMREVKHPFREQGIRAQAGIEY